MMQKPASVAAALLAASAAQAIPPGEPPEIEVFVAGSAAQDESLENLMRLAAGVIGTPNICQDGSLDIYRGTIDGTEKRVFYCLTSEHIDGVPPGLRLAVHKSSAGSSEGVAPVAQREAIPYIDLENLPDIKACRQPSRVLYAGNLAAYSDRYDCGGEGKLAVPILGFSDIEPALLGENTTGVRSQSKSQIVWGLPVSKNFRNALQAIQGLVPADVAHDAGVRETEANMPTLSTAQVASIFAGTITSWGQLYDRQGNPIYLSQDLPVRAPERRDLSGTRPGAYQPSSDGGQRVYVCRRTVNSGTQAAYEIHYLRRRCMADAPHFIAPDDGSSVTRGGDPDVLVRQARPAGRVFAGSNTADVRACLDAHDDHNRWAIGMFSTENIGNNASFEFRHIKVDGQAPTLINAHLGRWTHVSEPTLQWRSSREWDADRRLEALTVRFIQRNVGQPRVLSSLNSAFEHPWGRGGYLALPQESTLEAPAPVTRSLLDEYPVSGTTPNAQSLKGCHVPVIKGQSSAAM